MVALITLVSTLVISLLVTRIGSVALSLTGMAQDAARFQARSAYTGVGFTTSESEQVVNHPVRRRVLAVLMLTGNVGIAVVIASMMATFVQTGESSSEVMWGRALVLAVALLALWIIGTQKFVDQTIEYIIERALKKWTKIDVRDYVSLLHLADGYVVYEIHINEGDWIADKTLSQSMLTAEGVLVLGIHRDSGKYLGSPNGKSLVKAGDVLSVYGPSDRLEELDVRKKGYEGDRAHKIAIETQQEATKKVDEESGDGSSDTANEKEPSDKDHFVE